MKVLVTGGAGFIGSHLVEELNRRRILCIVVDDLSKGNLENLKGLKYDFYKINICSPKLAPLIKKVKPDYVFHLAAQTSIASSIKNPKNDIEVNLLGTLNVISSIKNPLPKKIIFASSAAVYGISKTFPIIENSPKNPFSTYGISKLTSEILISNWAKENSVSFVNLRFGNVYGERQDSSAEGGVVSIFIEKLLKNDVVTVYEKGAQTRDFIYVKDVIAAMVQSMDKKITGTFNIGTNSETSINRLLDLLQKISKRKVKRVYKKRDYLEAKRNFLSYRDFSKTTGWLPRTDIESGLKNTYGFFAINHSL